jgi:hypothetical protein
MEFRVAAAQHRLAVHLRRVARLPQQRLAQHRLRLQLAELPQAAVAADVVAVDVVVAVAQLPQSSCTARSNSDFR